MSEAASILLGPLNSLLEYFRRNRHYRDEKKDAALLAISQALTETQKYIELSGGTKCFDREREHNLAQLWRDAAIKSRHVSTDIATKLNEKSEHWSDNLEWSSDEVLRKGIDIPAIQAVVTSLLRNA
jgi:hypothetical protein